MELYKRPTSKEPTMAQVQDVQVGFGKFSWTWSFRLGNGIVCGPGYRNERAARRGLAEYLEKRGLSAPAKEPCNGTLQTP
jgi:hypothetical protein